MDVNRQKKPTLRQRQAQATREMIAGAAQALFLERGYTSTTIEAIADQAGVAVSTVYAVFGSKRGILRAIREAWHRRSHIREVAADSARLDDPGERLELLARASEEQWETGAEVMAIYNAASAADPEAAAELAEALAGRQKALDTFARGLEPYLRPGLSVDKAAGVMRALCLSEIFDELVGRSGWSGADYRTWLAAALKRELLGVNS